MEDNPHISPQKPADSKHGLAAFTPLFIGIALAIGCWIGFRLTAPNEGASDSESFAKLEQILKYVDNEYVDEVDRNAIVEKMIHSMLQDLDPHSYYISASELSMYNDPMEGNFEGVGIEFLIRKDTLVVVHALEGGPSAEKGIRAGDRVVAVDGENIAGINISNERIGQLLKGEKGTAVTMTIKRRGANAPIDFTVTRDAIPIYSVDVSYMVDEEIGYLKLARFSKTTPKEFEEATDKLLDQGMKKLVLDLRANGGGIYEAALSLADAFLKKGELIVFTDGQNQEKIEDYATASGNLEDIEVVILIDNGSASASEIVAGAIQDNDRGTIVGQRSFGKGLVQSQKPLADGSAFRLTVARYYTPTGRCIQKPYDSEAGYAEYFGNDMDTMPVPDSLVFQTPGGKTVYGGGGITPDIQVGIDTAGGSWYLSELVFRGIIHDFAFQYVDRNRGTFDQYSNAAEYVSQFEVTETLLQRLIVYAEEAGMPPNEIDLRRSEYQIKTRLKALIGRNLYQNIGYYPVILQQDLTYKEALKSLKPSVD